MADERISVRKPVPLLLRNILQRLDYFYDCIQEISSTVGETR